MKTFRQFMQLAYVTNDFNRALKQFADRHGVTRFLEMRNEPAPTLAGRFAQLHVGLAWASETTQVELIAPLSGDDAIYRSALRGDAFSVVMHHVGQQAASQAEFDALREEARTLGLAVVIDTPAYFYVDTRATLGHCIEHINTPEHMSLERRAVRDSIPRN